MNIIIHGLEDQEEESNLQLLEKIRATFRDMGIKIEMKKEIIEIRRLGGSTPDDPFWIGDPATRDTELWSMDPVFGNLRS
ncbi:hypothetical protein FQA39_LY04901 [Lamprigera yunnana]|nr:hypothetical protein FQA39_LY04901 [Lamprigera yunnana]